MPSDIVMTLLLIEIILALIPLLIMAMSQLDAWLARRRHIPLAGTRPRSPVRP